MRSPEETSARLPHLPEQPQSKNIQAVMKAKL